MMTPELLRTAVGCTPERADLFAPHLSAACRYYGIDTPERLAAFLAQIGHESGSLRYVREIADGSAYEGRRDLGNLVPGDGTRYRGRGLIQLTGRDNYRQMRDLLDHLGPPDFLDFPAALEEPQWAAWSAAAWWHSRHLSDLADAGDFDAITRRINGGHQRRGRPQAALGAREGRAGYPCATGARKHAQRPADAAQAPSKEQTMPIPAIVAAVLPSLIEAIPKLGKVFGSGSEVADRNIKAAELVVETVKAATGAVNAQDAAERIKSDPAAARTAAQAVDSIWYELTEAGGGGVDGARRADAAQRAGGDLLHSASFWVALLLLPLVYLLVLSLIGLVGTATWSDDVRAGLSGSLISAVIGGLVGYYYGQTTTRNRAPVP
jgi:putative chitinase